MSRRIDKRYRVIDDLVEFYAMEIFCIQGDILMNQHFAMTRQSGSLKTVKPAMFVFLVSFFTSVSLALDSEGQFFQAGLPEVEWTEFKAAGFSKPVAGVIFNQENPTCCGVALGGLGTGSLDIETSGTLGFNCIFNPPNWPRGRSPQLQLPFLGLSLGQDVWVLTTQKFIDGGTIDGCTDPMNPFRLGKIPPELLAQWQSKVPKIEGVRAVKEIRYWGHYPVVDMEYETDAPVSVALRGWSPFIPGDMIASRIPGAVFEIHLRNNSDVAQKGTLAFSFPGPNRQTESYPTLAEEEGIKVFQQRNPLVDDYGQFRSRNITEKKLKGVQVTSVSEKTVSYFLGVMDNQNVRLGKGLALDPKAWSRISTQLPQLNTEGDLSAWGNTQWH